jgi:hypothetical protein
VHIIWISTKSCVTCVRNKHVYEQICIQVNIYVYHDSLIIGKFYLSSKAKVKVKVMLQPTVSRPVRPGVRHPSGTRDQFFFLLEIFFRRLRVCYLVAPSLTKGRVCNLLLLTVLILGHVFAWPLPSNERFYSIRYSGFQPSWRRYALELLLHELSLNKHMCTFSNIIWD